jgi:hypothetical protein
MDPLIDEEFGGWPSGSNFTWDASNFNLSHLLLKSNQYNNFPFYYVATTIDYRSSDKLRYRIRVSTLYDHKSASKIKLNYLD